MTTEQQLYFEAYAECCTSPEWQDRLKQIWMAMDACNLSGVVHSWSEWVTELWNEAHRLGHGTDWVNRHPVNVIVADKLRQLTYLGNGELPESWAYEWVCHRVSGD